MNDLDRSIHLSARYTRSRTQVTTADHVKDTTWGTNNDLDTLAETLDALAHVGATNACGALNLHVVTKGEHDFLNLKGRSNKKRAGETLRLIDYSERLATPPISRFASPFVSLAFPAIISYLLGQLTSWSENESLALLLC